MTCTRCTSTSAFRQSSSSRPPASSSSASPCGKAHLAAEAVAAEPALLAQPDLVAQLGLPAPLGAALAWEPVTEVPRVARFDFHPTAAGEVVITEGNLDALGGWAEASAITAASAAMHGASTFGDPAAALARLLAQASNARPVGLLHRTQFTEVRQVVTYLARACAKAGVDVIPFDATALRCTPAGPAVATRSGSVPLGAVFRYFPAEWLPLLHAETGWSALARDRACINPLVSVLTQSKRFPLAWDAAGLAVPTWRALLPETQAFDGGGLPEDAVLKPALAHEGLDVTMHGIGCDVSGAVLRARGDPSAWVLQRRFKALALETPEGVRYPAIGIFVIGGRAVGCYARLSRRPRIDANAQFATVLCARDNAGPDDDPAPAPT